VHRALRQATHAHKAAEPTPCVVVLPGGWVANDVDVDRRWRDTAVDGLPCARFSGGQLRGCRMDGVSFADGCWTPHHHYTHLYRFPGNYYQTLCWTPQDRGRGRDALQRTFIVRSLGRRWNRTCYHCTLPPPPATHHATFVPAYRGPSGHGSYADHTPVRTFAPPHHLTRRAYRAPWTAARQQLFPHHHHHTTSTAAGTFTSCLQHRIPEQACVSSTAFLPVAVLIR